MRRRSGLTIVEALIVFVVLCGLWWALTPGLRHARRGHRQTKCANNLRQLALGAIQYSDDRRFFPHLAGKRELDGGMETSDTPRKLRLLVELGYAEPSSFVCPFADDRELALTDAARRDLRAWSWDALPPDVAPPTSAASRTRVERATADPTLLETTELSYGWTRRFLTMGARSTERLGADRASRKDDARARPPGLVGNHANGANVVYLDGTVRWLPAADEAAPHLADVTSTTLSNGVVLQPGLTVEPPVLVPALEERFVLPDADQLLWGFGPPLALLALLLGGVLAGRRKPAPPG